MKILTRIILACTGENDWILDPFSGSSTTGITANLSGRRFLGIEKELDFVNISKVRRTELDNSSQKTNLISRLSDLSFISKESLFNEPF